ncbi:hypothetical protein MKD38_09120 [Cupriavidus sp. WGlv3]|uniref:hypothetical protein n=1 Tax=Cupriavidus sp. WGlv3 TaxID=2919924 RepID=UPI0020900445|nr:hypothetical protein [Cupriavidus sp. WGlv3]MCO4861830.1 hypothetical protein [Cupriavidus sp. WGlv3]
MQSATSPLLLSLGLFGIIALASPDIFRVAGEANDAMQVRMQALIAEQRHHCRQEQCTRLHLLETALRADQCHINVPAIVVSASIGSTWSHERTIPQLERRAVCS